MPVHVHPTAPLAERVLLPGDPGRALRLANALLDKPRMFNHNRGLWGYTGAAADGQALTIQSTGMGGPSAAIVITELIELGARRFIRVGTCGALDPDLRLGEILLVTEAFVADGTSRALGAGARVGPDPVLVDALTASGELRPAGVASTDLFYGEVPSAGGAQALDMETTTLFTVAAASSLPAASILIVSDLILPARTRIEPDALEQAEGRAGGIAAAALGPEADPVG
jgi:uridine phosphorylase